MDAVDRFYALPGKWYTEGVMSDETSETQQELFKEFSDTPQKPERLPGLAKTQKPILISTTLEQLLMVGIVSVLVFCGIFFLGVLRGKSLTHPIMASQASTRPSLTTRMALPAAVPATVPQQVKTGQVQPPTRQVAAATVLSPDKPYTIQVVTHRKEEFAEQEVSRLRRMGYASFIIPSGEYFQVCAGQYTNKNDAKKDLVFFASKFKDCFLRHR